MVRPIGQGGMGMVVLGHDPQLDRKVAIKFVRSELAAEQSFVDRFLREARLSARLNHPNIVSIYQVGRHQGAPYLVMEFIDGVSLRELLRTPPPLTVGAVVGYALQCCEGLSAASAAGVIHRDIKPANLMVRRDGVLKIMDFGLSKSVRGDSNTITNAILGTPEYMSPEQSQGLPTDFRTDVYALGITLFQGVTGYLPFTSDSAIRTMMRHQTEPLPDDPRLRAIAGGRLWKLIQAMTEKDPANRPVSWAEIRLELQAVAEILAADPHEPETRLAPQNMPSPVPTPGPRRPASAPISLLPAGTPPRATPTPASRPSGRVRRARRTATMMAIGLGATGLLTVGALALTGGLDFRALMPSRPPREVAPAPAPTPAAAATVAVPPTTHRGITLSSRSGATWADVAMALQAENISLVFDGIDPARESAAFHLTNAEPEAVLKALCLAAGWEDEASGDGIHRLRPARRPRCEEVAESVGLVNRERLPRVTVNTATESRTLGDVAEAMRLSGNVNYLIADRRLAELGVGRFALVDKPLSAVLTLAREQAPMLEWTYEDGILIMVPCVRKY